MRRPRLIHGMWPGTIVLVLSVSACGTGEPGSEGAIAPGTPLGLSPDPVLVVGERPDDPTHELFSVRSPFLLPDGGLAFGLGAEATIRIYDAAGDYRTSLGAEGEGPGEFVRLAATWARGDTIEAFDPESYRMTRFVPGGGVETILLEGVSSAQSVVAGVIGGGWVLYGVQEVQRTGRDLIAVHLFSPDGTHVRQLQLIEGFRRHEFAREMGAGPDPISPRPIIRASGESVYVAETLTPKITETRVLTYETDTIEWTDDDRISGGDAASAARSSLLGSGLSENVVNWNLASFDALGGDEQAPVFWDFLVDGDRFLWVRNYDPTIHGLFSGALGQAGPGGVWSIRDRTGAKVGEIEIPSDFEPWSIDGDRLIGIRRDAWDVESVRVYRIERSGS